MDISPSQIEFFKENGYLVVENIINAQELKVYQELYDAFLNNEIDTGANRADLGENLGPDNARENITQIMWPSDFVNDLTNMSYHKNSLLIAKKMLGNDIEMDFDMLINKAPHTHTITPWHQDAAYWVDLPDKRAISCWMALDVATIQNGCMWYIPKSHRLELRKHEFANKKGGALTCKASEKEGIAVELKPGSCVFHDGRTIHYSRGNSTGFQRRAYIINFRPKKMILLEREKGMDHGRFGKAADRKLSGK